MKKCSWSPVGAGATEPWQFISRDAAIAWNVSQSRQKQQKKHSNFSVFLTPCKGQTSKWDFRSEQISRSVVSDSLRPHESQHARPSCPSPTPGVHPDSRPSSQWCHPEISSSVVPSSCPQSLPASESFPMSQLCMRWPKYWSFSFSIIPSKEHPGLISFRMDWLDLLAVQGTLKSLFQHHSSKASFL